MQNTQIRQAIDPRHAKSMDTEELRSEFLIERLFEPGCTHFVYSHLDRLIVGGAMPGSTTVTIDKIAETGTANWLDRREATIVNIGSGQGQVKVGGESHTLSHHDMLYLGMGAGPVELSGDTKFYILSAPAHRSIPTRLITIDQAAQVPLGARETSNERTIYQFVHPDVMESCQLVIGITKLASGSVWNTMPAHLHDRRSEAYLYLDVPDDQRVFHFMGQADETRHLIVSNEQAILSPGWSIHCGAGTSSYSFLWCMAGDNVDYTDVEMVGMSDLR